VWALSALHSHSHYWLCYLGNTRVTVTRIKLLNYWITRFWCRSVISSFIRSGFILPPYFLHSYFTFFLPAFFISQSISSLWTANYQAYHDFFFQFWWWRKPKCSEETTGTWFMLRIPLRCNIPSVAQTPWLQACKSDTLPLNTHTHTQCYAKPQPVWEFNVKTYPSPEQTPQTRMRTALHKPKPNTIPQPQFSPFYLSLFQMNKMVLTWFPSSMGPISQQDHTDEDKVWCLA
jgi:hypothetical protein